MQFLMGLNETFDGVRSQILVMEPLPHVDKAFSMVMRVERQRKVHMETAETGINNAMYARNGDQERIGYKTFVKKKNVDKRFLTCTCCGKSGHTKESCFKVHGVPDWYKDLIDKKRKENRSVTDPVKVHFAQFEEELAGTAQLTDSIALAEVLHIPSFQHNLLSVSQLCKALPIRFIFHNSSCILQDQRTEEVLAIGNQIGKLFYLTPSSFSSTAVNKRTKSVPEFVHLSQDCTSYELWHKRLGHPSENVIDHIPTLRCKQPKEQSVCSICPLAKQSRKSFPSSDSSADTLFALIHVDIWGPYKQSSLSGCHYVLTVVDDHSRTTWTYLMRYKAQAITFLSTFFRQVQTQYNLSVKCIRLIMVQSFSALIAKICSILLALYIKNLVSIHHNKTCSRERKHKHLLQVARALMFESYLPKQFWAESILAATYIINRLPSPILNWKSPYEILHHKSPSYQFLRAFGCLCFSTNVQPHKTKFEPRATKCVFIGYAQGQKGYKLYDLEHHSVFVSRDVTFHENYFPYKHTSDISTSCPIPLPISSSVFSLLKRRSQLLYLIFILISA
ncbi:Retrovirus-related Pol polyprotein from transposon RE1 [Sesamum angolense]|uniref:Retrovirus-related Pol polyprotein from transposon RE1 n=1 Tax=Sesamum angolense TaxID=2727404 RepID=A0AAE1T4Q0_9LAMI|nr:Retrovirus-related Pol polyprotein from transposon RE1 [Sesamum angolense]